MAQRIFTGFYRIHSFSIENQVQRIGLLLRFLYIAGLKCVNICSVSLF